MTPLTLSRLSRHAGAALVAQVAKNNALPDEIVAEIVNRTDGVPLFVEEMTKAVLEAGANDGGGGATVMMVPYPAQRQDSILRRKERGDLTFRRHQSTLDVFHAS